MSALARYDELAAEPARRVDVDDLDANAGRDPLARFAKPNAATRAIDRAQAAFDARDWVALRAVCADDAKVEDRRRHALVSGDADWWVTDLRTTAEALHDARWDRRLVATAGDRLALERILWSGRASGGPVEIEYLRLVEVDETGRVSVVTGFDLDDRRAADQELRDTSSRHRVDDRHHARPRSTSGSKDQRPTTDHDCAPCWRRRRHARSAANGHRSDRECGGLLGRRRSDVEARSRLPSRDIVRGRTRALRLGRRRTHHRHAPRRRSVREPDRDLGPRLARSSHADRDVRDRRRGRSTRATRGAATGSVADPAELSEPRSRSLARPYRRQRLGAHCVLFLRRASCTRSDGVSFASAAATPKWPSRPARRSRALRYPRYGRRWRARVSGCCSSAYTSWARLKAPKWKLRL